MRLYLDCDNVLADFDSGAAEVLGMDRHRYQTEFGRKRYLDRLAAAPDFYATLPLRTGARQLFEAVRHLNPIILSGVPEGAWAAPQKAIWVNRHFPGTRLVTVPQESKSDYCEPGDILIDDKEDFRHLWEAAGGHFIHHRTTPETLAEFGRRFPELSGWAAGQSHRPEE